MPFSAYQWAILKLLCYFCINCTKKRYVLLVGWQRYPGSGKVGPVYKRMSNGVYNSRYTTLMNNGLSPPCSHRDIQSFQHHKKTSKFPNCQYILIMHWRGVHGFILHSSIDSCVVSKLRSKNNSYNGSFPYILVSIQNIYNRKFSAKPPYWISKCVNVLLNAESATKHFYGCTM